MGRLDYGKESLNDVQRVLLCVYLSFTVMILIFDHIYRGEMIVQYIKFTIMLSLFLSALFVRKNFPEQKLMVLSLLFLVAGDFFLVILSSINIGFDPSAFGILGFLCAYICLIAAYQKNFRLGRQEIMAAIPVGLVFVFVCVFIQSDVKGSMRIFALVFGLILGYMTWTSVCTIYRGYYSKKSAKMIALSGWLMFICDMGVAVSMFYPYDYSAAYVPLLKNIIWGAYIPGWALLGVIICEKNLLQAHRNER